MAAHVFEAFVNVEVKRVIADAVELNQVGHVVLRVQCVDEKQLRRALHGAAFCLEPIGGAKVTKHASIMPIALNLDSLKVEAGVAAADIRLVRSAMGRVRVAGAPIKFSELYGAKWALRIVARGPSAAHARSFDLESLDFTAPKYNSQAVANNHETKSKNGNKLKRLHGVVTLEQPLKLDTLTTPAAIVRYPEKYVRVRNLAVSAINDEIVKLACGGKWVEERHRYDWKVKGGREMPVMKLVKSIVEKLEKEEEEQQKEAEKEAKKRKKGVVENNGGEGKKRKIIEAEKVEEKQKTKKEVEKVVKKNEKKDVVENGGEDEKNIQTTILTRYAKKELAKRIASNIQVIGCCVLQFLFFRHCHIFHSPSLLPCRWR